MQTILFVCVANAGRSQMAEAFARKLAPPGVVVYSAGSRPSGTLHPVVVNSMREIGYNLSAHHSKSLDEIPQIMYDYVITMGCGDACPLVRAARREDWNIPDPQGRSPEQVRSIRDEIGTRVRSLIERITRNA